MKSQFVQALSWIDSQALRMQQLVIDWANINTGTYNTPGLAILRQRLFDIWSAIGGEISEIDLPDEQTIDSSGQIIHSPLGKALLIRKRADAPFRVFFCIHMDTVYPADSPFQKCDFLDANTLRGPGVTDAKGGLAIMLTTVEAIERSPLADSIGWEVLINPDEEIGSPGSSTLFEIAARRNHVGLLFEPAYGSGDLVSERGGSGSFTIVVKGRSAHAGRDPQAGRNAIHALAQLIVQLADLSLPGATINVGKVEGGGPVNVVPDLAIGRFNVRVKTPADQILVVHESDRMIDLIRQRDGIQVQLHGGFHRPPKPLDAPTRQLLDQAIKSGQELNLSFSTSKSGGVSDGNQLAAAGLPNLDSLGPRGGRIHSHDEYLLLDSLTERAKLSAHLVLSLADKAINARV